MDRFADRGVKVDLRTAELIVTQSQPKLLDLSNEIDKIILYKPNANHFTFNEVSELIGYTRDNTVFDLSNAVAARNHQKCFNILQNIISSANQEVKIIAVLRELFTKICKLIDLHSAGNSKESMAKQIGVPPFYLNDYLIALEKYSFEDINNAFLVLCKTDKELKSTSSNKKLLMQEMLAEIVLND